MGIVEAILTVASSKDRNLAERIELAQDLAVQACLANGVSPYDAKTLIAAKMAAREAVLHPPADESAE